MSNGNGNDRESGNNNNDVKPPIKNKQPPVLFKKTQEVVRELEKQLDGPLLTYWNSPNGNVCANDVVGFYEILQAIGRKDRLYLLIKSGGGEGRSSLRIVNLLRQFAQRVIALVPLQCASAATMLALGADEIRMGPLAYLTAVDTSLRHSLSPLDARKNRVSVSQNELSRILKLWETASAEEKDTNVYQTLFQYVHPLVVGAVDRSSSLSIRLCQEILSFHMDDQTEVTRIAETLNEDYPSHSYPITLREAQRIGLNAKEMEDTVGRLLLELTELYSEMGQRAYTDHDEHNYHDNEIINILEGSAIQVYYQVDKDWHYRKEEQRWYTMNDDSSWRKIEHVDGRNRKSVFHIR